MARGIKQPSRAVNGRFEMLDGDEYIEQLIKVGLASSDSENPFQPQDDLDGLIFDINDSKSDGEARIIIERLFDLMSQDQLARLEDLTFSSEGGVKNCDITYINLETGARNQMSVPLNGGLF